MNAAPAAQRLNVGWWLQCQLLVTVHQLLPVSHGSHLTRMNSAAFACIKP